MNNLKYMSILLSVCMFAMVTGCSQNDTSTSDIDSSQTATEVSIATENDADTETVEINPEQGENPQEQHGKPIQELEMNDEFLAKLLTTTDKPDETIKNDVNEEDYVGLWECAVIVSDETAYSGMFDIPLSATDRLKIEADKSGTLVSVKAGEEQASTETTFTWNFADGVLKAEADGTELTMQMTETDKLMVTSDVSDKIAYYQKVDSFTDFDFSSVDFDFDALFE